MLRWITRFFINHRITAHNRTSHKKSTDDDYGGYSYRAAKILLSYRVCFGCFVFCVLIHNHCRSPPTLPNIQKIKFENSEVKAMLKNNFNKFSSNVCNFCFSVVTYTKGEKENTNFLHGKEVAQ